MTLSLDGRQLACVAYAARYLRRASRVAAVLCLLGAVATPSGVAVAAPFLFSTGNPDGRIGTASRPSAGGVSEIESADDFVLTADAAINHVTFVGLLVGGNTSNVLLNQTVLEMYRVFPKDSDVARTSGPPVFSTPQVPTRVNSPSDVEIQGRESADFSGASLSVLNPTFTVLNSVTPGGIHPSPDQTTGGNLAQTGVEVLFDITLSNPFHLPPDHYFFVPQIAMSSGFFLWLSAPRPIVAPGTPFPPGFTDLQSWTRDQNLDPDWLRVGADIVGGNPAPTFNAAFSLEGTVPLPGTLVLVLLGLAGFAFRRWQLGS